MADTIALGLPLNTRELYTMNEDAALLGSLYLITWCMVALIIVRVSLERE